MNDDVNYHYLIIVTSNIEHKFVRDSKSIPDENCYQESHIKSGHEIYD